MTDTAGFAAARLGAALCPLQHRDAEHLGVGFMMFLIAFLLFVGAFAVTQIASETKGLTLDVIAPPTR
jgi:uncharacterized membrane protein YhhN